MNGMNLIDADAYVTTVLELACRPSRSGTSPRPPTCSPPKSASTPEFTSLHRRGGTVIDTGNDDVATGDRIAIDVDVAGTGAKGLGVILTFSS